MHPTDIVRPVCALPMVEASNTTNQITAMYQIKLPRNPTIKSQQLNKSTLKWKGKHDCSLYPQNLMTNCVDNGPWQ